MCLGIIDNTIGKIVCAEIAIKELKKNDESKLEVERIRTAIHRTNRNMPYATVGARRFKLLEDIHDTAYVTKDIKQCKWGSSKQRELEVHVGQQWYDKIYTRGLAYLEHRNACGMVSDMELKESDDLCDIYEADVHYIKGTAEERDFHYWSPDKDAKLLALYKSEKLWIAVSKKETGNKLRYGTGQDAAWAKRTLKRRQKSEMAKSLGCLLYTSPSPRDS